MGHTREHADVFEMESIHVHSTVLPEVWAVAEAEQRTDQDPLTAVSVAPDVPCWLRFAYNPQDVQHPSAVQGYEMMWPREKSYGL